MPAGTDIELLISDNTLQLLIIVSVFVLALLVIAGIALSAHSYTQLLDLVKNLLNWVIDLEKGRKATSVETSSTHKPKQTDSLETPNADNASAANHSDKAI